MDTIASDFECPTRETISSTLTVPFSKHMRKTNNHKSMTKEKRNMQRWKLGKSVLLLVEFTASVELLVSFKLKFNRHGIDLQKY